jgi:hypothetical protein
VRDSPAGTNQIQKLHWKAGQHEMGKPYSEDLRERVIGAAQDGATNPEIAERLGVSISSVVHFRRLRRETGSISPAKFGGYTRLYGRAPRGERLVQKVPHGTWKTIPFIAALRHDRVTAPFVLEGPMTGESEPTLNSPLLQR